MLASPPSAAFLLAVFSLLSVARTSVGTEEQCHMDCRDPATRTVGPTRPWHESDRQGNALSLTRPHPFSVAGSEVARLSFELTLRLSGRPPLSSDLDLAGRLASRGAEEALAEFRPEVSIVDARPVAPSSGEEVGGTAGGGEDAADVVVRISAVADRGGYDYATADELFFDRLLPTIRGAVESGELTRALRRTPRRSDAGRPSDLTVSFPPPPFDAASTTYDARMVLNAGHPNPYARFCEAGCTLFFSSPNDPATLAECTGKCDDLYRYNVTVGYNDLAEVARLECRDGCRMALIRCQPGYYCTQASVLEETQMPPNTGEEETRTYAGGIMAHCPPGTYRDVSYDSVEECVPCPPGRYREDIKGRDLESCAKCPAGTYAASFGSSSVRQCLRCPAGRFNAEEGAAQCKCITPMACEEDQPPSPADAEKRDTVPYIGRW